MYTQGAVHRGAVDAQEHPVSHTGPRGVVGSAIETLLKKKRNVAENTVLNLNIYMIKAKPSIKQSSK